MRERCAAEWYGYTHHPFVGQIADGSLDPESFKHYLIQLYLFSKHYSRAYALAVVKSEHLDDLREAAAHVDLQLNFEMALHIDYCKRWGLSQEELDRWPEEDANRLYTRYVMDQGLTGDLLDLLVALAPCSLGYAEIGARLVNDPATRLAGNPYRDWIELHGGPEFQEGANELRRFIGRVARRRGVDCDAPSSAPRWETLEANFRTASGLEIRFFDMGLRRPRPVED
ncbi:TenA family protein [Salipiger sp. P9]|nr:TenA family protein [Salipiger pentaromativorans]MCR8548945.1 TenA family protein [Salipiger pentaromativorans]